MKPNRPKAILLVFVFVGGCACVAISCSRQRPAHRPTGVTLVGANNWKKEVLEAQQPVLVEFGATWCGPCQSMIPALESLARDYKVCTVDVDRSRSVAEAQGISPIPVFLFFKDGRVVARIEGAVPEAELRAKMQELIGNGGL